MPSSFYRRTLPHWDVAGATYFVTMCLEGSAPARRKQPDPGSPANATPGPTRSAGQEFVDYDTRLDLNLSVRWLENPRLAAAVTDAIRWGGGSRYDLLAYVVMPNHVHWVFTPLVDKVTQKYFQRLAITTAFKRHTAWTCNRLLGRRGRFWQEESYDRVVRSDEELERIVRYVEHNPVRAGLCARAGNWAYSSAASGRSW
jgi:REP element-mobilizing transposase RayT